MSDRPILMTPEEMESRITRNDDPFELVVEKWERLASFLEMAFTLDDYNVFLAGCQVPIPFCQMYGAQNRCDLCPIMHLCQGTDEDRESMWSGLSRMIQAYGWAGDMLPPEPLKNYVQRFIRALTEASRDGQRSSSPRSPETNP